MTISPGDEPPSRYDDFPDRGDLGWVNFDPRAWHEQAGNRPAVVLSLRGYHFKTPYFIVCPITSNMKPYPFKVALPDGLPIRGAVLVDQVKSFDRWARGFDPVARLPDDVMADIRGRLAALLGIVQRKG